jgi:hypothetical protein
LGNYLCQGQHNNCEEGIAGKKHSTKKTIYFTRIDQQINRMGWAGHVARMGEDRCVHRVLVGKPEGNRPLGRPRRRWVDNIKMDLQEVGGGRGDWMELAQDRDSWRALVGTVRDFWVP